jgi:hypothetical protein
MVGNDEPATAIVSVTSAGTLTPGAYRAIRVARVTPSLMISSPSLPRLTSTGGIPSVEIPYRENCRCSFRKSAPLLRLPGTRSVAGSTSRKSPRLILTVSRGPVGSKHLRFTKRQVRLRRKRKMCIPADKTAGTRPIFAYPALVSRKRHRDDTSTKILNVRIPFRALVRLWGRIQQSIERQGRHPPKLDSRS